MHNVYEGSMKTIYAKYPKVRVIFFKDDDEYIDFLIDMDKKLTDDSSSERPQVMMRKAVKPEEIKENYFVQLGEYQSRLQSDYLRNIRL